MKILQKSQIQEADRQTICLEPIASIELMERAAKACFQWICQHYNIDQKFTLLCGTGNNGGGWTGTVSNASPKKILLYPL